MKKIVIALTDAAEILKAMEADGEEMTSENFTSRHLCVFYCVR